MWCASWRDHLGLRMFKNGCVALVHFRVLVDMNLIWPLDGLGCEYCSGFFGFFGGVYALMEETELDYNIG